MCTVGVKDIENLIFFFFFNSELLFSLESRGHAWLSANVYLNKMVGFKVRKKIKIKMRLVTNCLDRNL